MYRKFFGMRDRPFDLTPNPRFLVLTDAHREALSTIEYGLTSAKGITVLIGEAGTGKTTLIRTALERQPQRVHCVHLHNPALTRPEFVEMLAARLDLSGEARESKTMLLIELERLMRDRLSRGESTVLVVDEAQSTPFDLLEEIRLLANIETDDRKLLSLVMAGQPELADMLNNPALRQLKQRVALRAQLRALTQTETLGYLAGRIAAAGGTGAHAFTQEAATLIHERSGGIPRSISVIADNALLTAFAMGKRPVTRGIVEEVCRDLDLPGNRDRHQRGTVPPAVQRLVDRTGSATHLLARDQPPAEQHATDDSGEDVQSEPEAADTGARPDPGAGETANTGGGVFGFLWPKRRRFSFGFTRQG